MTAFTCTRVRRAIPKPRRTQKPPITRQRSERNGTQPTPTNLRMAPQDNMRQPWPSLATAKQTGRKTTVLGCLFSESSAFSPVTRGTGSECAVSSPTPQKSALTPDWPDRSEISISSPQSHLNSISLPSSSHRNLSLSPSLFLSTPPPALPSSTSFRSLPLSTPSMLNLLAPMPAVVCESFARQY